MKDAMNNSTPATIIADAAVRHTRILVVEDNDLARKQLQQLLQTNKAFQVDSVGDGQKALAALLENTYSIVLTDLRLPGFDGLELIRTIQERLAGDRHCHDGIWQH